MPDVRGGRAQLLPDDDASHPPDVRNTMNVVDSRSILLAIARQAMLDRGLEPDFSCSV